MAEPSARLQWAIIIVGYVIGIALCVWLISRGLWYVAAALVGASVAMGLNARRESRPLYPGAPPSHEREQ